jgi:hypoxanthine phosphoribosyltransferase
MALGKELYLDWERIEVAIERLLNNLKAGTSVYEPTRIIGITKGGVIPAALVHQAFPEAQFHVIHVSSRIARDKQAPVIKNLTPDVYARMEAWNGPETLVVDDLCDTGDTFALLRKYLPRAKYAAMLLRNDTEENPNEEWDFFGEIIEPGVWAVFPWEPITED